MSLDYLVEVRVVAHPERQPEGAAGAVLGISEPVGPAVSPQYGVMRDGVDLVHTFAEEQFGPSGRSADPSARPGTR
ncbi:hypothetical protein [Streptomyces sp. NPDC048636]|uniref:hypothetical protein n=1 Tax=Streptomyces sp. NPDC048636 TaxID=3155762 RepID=UPI00343CCFD7